MDGAPRKRLVSSPDAASRIAHAAAWLGARARADELVVVGGTMQAAAEITREVGRAAGATFGWHRMTLPQLAWRLAGDRLAQQGKVAVSALALEAVSARVVHAARGKG